MLSLRCSYNIQVGFVSLEFIVEDGAGYITFGVIVISRGFIVTVTNREGKKYQTQLEHSNIKRIIRGGRFSKGGREA